MATHDRRHFSKGAMAAGLLAASGAISVILSGRPSAQPTPSRFVSGLSSRALNEIARETVEPMLSKSKLPSERTRMREAEAERELERLRARIDQVGKRRGALDVPLDIVPRSDGDRTAATFFREHVEEGLGITPGILPLVPGYPEHDVGYACFPNHGGRNLVILGWPDLLALQTLLTLIPADYSRLSRTLAFSLRFLPLAMEVEPSFDGDFISRRPTRFLTSYLTIAMRTLRDPALGNRRVSECSVRDRFTGRYLYEANRIALHPQLR